MPSPVGHALAGLALGWMAQAAANPGPTLAPARWTARVGRSLTGYPALGVALALLPDFDILFGTHRTMSHSLGGALIVGAAAWALVLARRRPPAVPALLSAAAFGSHVFLDWLGQDTSAPYGLMALWPVSQEFLSSGADVFPAVSRRYWNPEQFVLVNLRAVAWEVVILGPIAAASWLFCRRRQARVRPRSGDSNRVGRGSLLPDRSDRGPEAQL